jgi:hypothetical protein
MASCVADPVVFDEIVRLVSDGHKITELMEARPHWPHINNLYA